MSTTSSRIYAPNVELQRMMGRKKQKEGWPFTSRERKPWTRSSRLSRAKRRQLSKNALRKRMRLASWEVRQNLLKQLGEPSRMAQKSGRGEVRLDSGRIIL